MRGKSTSENGTPEKGEYLNKRYYHRRCAGAPAAYAVGNKSCNLAPDALDGLLTDFYTGLGFSLAGCQNFSICGLLRPEGAGGVARCVIAKII